MTDPATIMNDRQPGSVIKRICARALDVLVVLTLVQTVETMLGIAQGPKLMTGIAMLAYFVGGDVAFGTTVGKRIFGLTVRSMRNDRPAAHEALGRECFILLSAVPFVGGYIFVPVLIALIVTVSISPTKQGFHDSVGGGTQVVRRSK